MTCLLRVELCAEVFKDVGDEFAGVEQGAYGGFMAMGRLMGFFADSACQLIAFRARSVSLT